MKSLVPARSANEIESRFRDEFEPLTSIVVDVPGQRIVNRSWPCIELLGNARGVVVEDTDLRGATLATLRGVQFVRCRLYAAQLPEDAQLVDCESDTLFGVAGRSTDSPGN